MVKETQTVEFQGFESPNYTMVPDQLFDQLMPDLSGAELKVLLYIIRRTFGFKKDEDSISLSQMLNGITTRDGRVLDRGVGLTKKTLLQALTSLKDRNIIFSERRRTVEKGDEPTVYRLNVVNSVKNGKVTPPVGEKLHQGGGVEITPGPRGKNSPTQETVEQKTDKQETDLSNIRVVSKQEISESQDDDPPETTDQSGFEPISSILKTTPRKKTDYDEDRQVILEYISDFSREFSDQASVKSSTTRAVNLFRRSALSREAFIACLYEARSITKERTAAIRTSSKESGRAFPTKHKMAYFFAIVEEKLGLREPWVPKKQKSENRTDETQDSRNSYPRSQRRLNRPNGP